MHEYQGDFEVHLTVRPPDAASLNRFRAWCSARGCKCVRIVLARGEHVEQPMATWRRSQTTLSLVGAEARRLALDLEGAAIPVVRLKVEADPRNDGVPDGDTDAATHGPTNYFEHHVKLLRDGSADHDLLLQACLKLGAHLSRNAWREAAHGQEERFVTLRGYRVGRTSAERRLQELLAVLNELGEHVIEIESEYVVLDSNLALDAGWLPQAT
jgi:hypothetical protein